VASEYRWADHQYDRLNALAVELVGHRATVIVAIGGPAPAVAVKAATNTVPIVFTIAGDPVKLGLVASLNRPGGNLTGVTTLASMVVGKQFEALHGTVPKAEVIGCLVNPTNPNAESDTKEAQDKAINPHTVPRVKHLHRVLVASGNGADQSFIRCSRTRSQFTSTRGNELPSGECQHDYAQNGQVPALP